MSGWFWKRRKLVPPEARWRVVIGPQQIEVTDDQGRLRRLARHDLAGVAIETNDSGPWGADVWWLLFEADDCMACCFPQGASGEGAALDHLMALPGFDMAVMAQAMGSTDNALFPVWRRADPA